MTDDRRRTESTRNTTALADHVRPLDTDDPAAPLDHGDLPAELGEASVIALGEATHGTREFFRLKHRFLRYLVTEHDARAFAMEANLPEARAMDDYVTHGRGDPADALSAVYFWTWQTEELRALLDWLRDFNADRPLDDRVRVFGFDAQYTHGAVERLRGFLDTVDPEFRAELDAALETLDDEGEPAHRADSLDATISAADGVLDRLAARFDAEREAYVAAASEDAYAFARRCVRVCEHAAAYKRAMRAWQESEDDAMERLLEIRDEAMSENVRWIRERADGPVVLWGHDAHVNREHHSVRDAAVRAPSMGARLADEYGDDYYAVGFAFGAGSFQAVGDRDGDTALREWAVDGPLAGTLESRLDALGHDVSVLDVRAARDDDRLADLLGSPTPHVSFGATYSGGDLAEYVTEYAYGEAFDAVCFVAETARATPL